MEKGWSSKFSTTNEVKEVVEEVSEDEGMGDEEMETTAPETGLNMWFVYDKVEDVESLLTVSWRRLRTENCETDDLACGLTLDDVYCACD